MSVNWDEFTPIKKPTGDVNWEDFSPVSKPRDRTVGEALKDTGAQLVEGAYNIAGAVPDLVAPDSRVAEFFREGAQAWRNRQSDPLLQRLAGAEEAIRRAGEDGVMSQVREAVSQYADDPALAARFVVTNLPSMIPGLVAAKGAAAASAARGASALGAISAGTTASGVTNAVLNAGGARGEAFEDIRDTLIRQGMSREEATDRALTGSLPSAAVGGVTGFVSGKTGLERSLLGPGTASSVLRRGVSSALTELGGEQLEEVTPKITTNLMAGRYDNRPATQDVGRTIVETAIGSAPGAVVSGASEGFDARLLAPRAEPDLQPQTEPTPVIDDRPMIERQPPADPGMAAPIQPPQTAPATAPATNPQARFAELDLLSMSRDLTLAEQAERDALAVQLEGDDDVGANPGVSPVDPGTPGGGRAVDPAGMGARGGTGPVPADGLEPGEPAGGAPDVPVSPGPRGPDSAVTGPGDDAGNGFKWGPSKGERYRVGVIGATGGVALEKRLPAGTAATFYVGKDGSLVDGDSVNLIGGGVDRLWIPQTQQEVDSAIAILDEMGRLKLADPARANAKAKLRALVAGQESQGKASVGAQSAQDPVVDAAAERLKTPVRLTALDEVDAIDSELATLSAQPPAPESQARIDELARNREAIVSTWPTAIRGTPTEFATEAGPRVAADYAIIDADNLVTSHDIDLRENPLYPKALQPRDRSRMASQAQVAKIANALDPTRLGLSADAASGAPIVGADGLVESGNARTIALKQVYRANGQKAADYRTWLAQTADQFGLTPQQVESMRQPVLVRVRTTPVNRAEFARQANASTVARMSASEQALSDAQRITSLDALNPTDDGDIGGSTDFIREFMALLPITEQADMIETDGKLSTTGYRRIESAILAKAYGDSPVLRRMTESRDDNLRNVSKALVRVAPLIASARDRMQAGALYDADLVPDLVSAVEGLSSIKDRGWTLESELSQGDLTGPKYSPEAAQMMRLIADNVRSPRRIADYLRAFYESLEAAGDPKQGSIFGDAGPAPTVGSLLNEAQRRVDDARRAEEVAAGRGGDREGAQPDAQGGQRPQDQGGGAPGTAEDRGMAGTDGQPAVIQPTVQPATAAPAAQAGAAVTQAPVGRDAKLPLGSTLYDGQGNPWRVQNRRNGILTLQPIVNGTPDTKAARTFVIDPEKAPANTQASRDPLYLQAPKITATAAPQTATAAPGGVSPSAQNSNTSAGPVQNPARSEQVPTVPRRYLIVPYNKREYAKSHGAKWDAENKLWYEEPAGGLGGEFREDTFISYRPSAYQTYGRREDAFAAAYNEQQRTGETRTVGEFTIRGRRIFAVVDQTGAPINENISKEADAPQREPMAGQGAQAQGPQASGAPAGTETAQAGAPTEGEQGVAPADRFPSISTVTNLAAGPGGRIKPRPIATGRPLYRETNVNGLDSLLQYDKQADIATFYVADNPDIALGQGDNQGVQVVFRPDSLSGRENQKPGTGDLAGREYATDLIAPRAVQSITMRKEDVRKLSGLARRALADFDREDLADGRVRYQRKGLALPAQPDAPRAAPDAAPDAAPAENAQGFLTAPTPESLAQAEAQRQQQAADQARRDAAPPPDDFVLSGSNSAADQARARGQMELGAEPPAQTAAPAAPVSRTPQEVVDAYRREFGATPSGMTPAQYRDFIDRRNAAEERAAQDLVEIAKRDGVQLPSGRNSGSIMLSPEPGNDGKTWRVTRFLADGTPSGHMEYNTALEAAKAALAEARGPSDLSDRPGQAERGIGRDGRTEADRYSARLAAAAEDLSGQALSETEDGEFDGLADALASFAKDGEVDAGELRQEVLKRIDASDAPEAQKAGIRTALDPTRGSPDTEQRQPITPNDAANMRAGDVITDEQGREFRAHRARGEFLDAHPIVNGRAMVSADTTIRFHLNPETASAYPERRSSPIYATGRNLNDEPAGATAKPEKAAKPAKKAAKQDDATIQDAGQKIGGARKDLWKERGLNTADLDQMTESEGATLAKKANVWKPDYEQIAKDADPVTAAMVKVVYDGLAAKPRQDTPQGRRDYVAAMQAVRAVYGSVRSVEQARDAFHALRVALGVERQEGTNFVPTKDQDAKRVMFSVYKGRSDPFVMQVTDLMRARDMVKAGFPDIAPWKRRFSVRPLTKGDGLSDRAAQLLTAEAEAAGTPVTLEQLKAGVFAVVSKAGKRLGFASTQADAEAMAAAMYERTKKNDENEEPSRPHLDKLNRSGLPQRIDRDVTAEDFLSAFGWRGIEFGNWAAQDERQRLLNMAYDALMDLAQITNMPPKALSLNGTMGLAFGARGGGKFAAHYEPGKLVINMTKLRGAGSLAHEWAHALDHYLGELDRQDAYQGNARGASGWNDQARYTGEPQDRMVQRDGKWVATKEMRLPNLRPDLAAAVDRLMKRLYETPIPRDEAIAIERANIQRIEQYIDAEKDVKLRKAFVEQLQRSKQVLADLEAGKPSERTKRSSYATEAQRLSGKSEKGYWIRPTEMFARAFESYVFDRLKAMGAESDYLVHGVEQDRFADLTRYKGNPYPTADERTAINAAFDALVGTLKTRETETGGVAVYEPQRGYVPEAEAPRRRYSDDSRQLQLYLEGTETDPGQAGEGLDQARANAVEAVDGLADTQTILGLALSKDLAARQRVRLVGQKVASPEDLAVLAQVYRDPRFETFRVLFVDDANRVVSQLGITQRLPGATPAIVGDNMRNFLDGLQEAAERVGARGYYLLHNHPSGIAMPSSADVQVTRTYAGASQMPMLGHVVIDTNEFSVIDASGIVRTEKRDFGQPAPFDSQAAYSGYQINGPAEVMALAKKLASDVDPNAVTLVTTNYQMQVLSVTTVPSAAITDDKAANRMLLTRSALKAKAARLFAIGRNESALEKLRGIILDGIHVSESGQVKSLATAGVLPPSEVFPESRRARMSPDTSPEFEYLRQQTLPNQLGVPNAERFRDMHRDIDAQFQGRSPTGVSPTELAQTDDGWVLSRKISRDRSVRVRVTPDHDAKAFIVAPTIYTSNLQSDMAVLQMVLEAATLARRRGYALRIKTGRAFGQQALMGLRKEFGGPFQFERPFLKLSADQLRMTDLAFLAFDAAIELRKERQAARQDAADYRPDVPAVFSRAPAGAPTGTPKAVQSVVDTIRARWANAPDIVVLADMQDPAVPAAVRNEDSRQRSMGATGEPEGFWYGGKAYLVASALPTSSDVVRALFHESLGHYGLRGAFGASLDGILDQLWVAQRARVTAKAAAYGYDTAKVAQRRLAAEEVLAEMAQSSPTLGFVRRAVAAIRTWLRETFPGLRMQLSDDEVIRSFILPARAFVEAGRRAAGATPVAARGQPVASLNDRDVEALVRQYAAVDGAPTEAAIRQAVRQFRDVERAYGGRDAYRRALDAGRTRLTYGQWVQVRTPNFKAWFGDWEAVRAQSRLDAMPAVQIAIPAEWRDLDVAQLRARVRSALESMVESGEPLRHPEIGEVAVRQRGTKKALSASADPAKLLVLGDLRRAFEASIFANATVNTEGDANVVGFEKLLAKVDVAGVPLAAVFTVQRMRDGRQFYNSVTVEDGREKAPVASPRDTPALRDGERATSAITGASAFVRRALDRVNPDTVSKAIDEQTGEPKVMYHGTQGDFNAFDPDRVGQNFRESEGGYFFTGSTALASAYASRRGGEGGNVIPAYLSLQNPLTLDVYLWSSGDTVASALTDKGYSLSDLFDADPAGAIQYAKNSGADGIFWKNGNDVFAVAFEPTQTKSAIGNVGTFDPATGDIRFSRGQGATISDMPETNAPGQPGDERGATTGRVVTIQDLAPVSGAVSLDRLTGELFEDGRLVVNENGDPALVDFAREYRAGPVDVYAYHGTEQEFSEFLPGTAGASWFSTDESHARLFGEVRRARIAIRDPLVMRFGDPEISKDARFIDAAREALAEMFADSSGDIEVDDDYININSASAEQVRTAISEKVRAGGYEVDELVVEIGRSAGADGLVLFDYEGSGAVLVAFERTQITPANDQPAPGSVGAPAVFSRSTLGPRAPAPMPTAQQTPLQRLKARVMDLTSPESLDRLIYNLQNKFIDLKRIQDHITAIGGTVTDLNDAYLGEELFHKRLATRTEAFLKDEVKPLMRQLRATGTTIEELERFLHARHAPEANRVLAERNPNQAMIDAKRTQLDADVRQLELDLQRATAAGTATKAIEQALEQARAARKEWVGAQAFQGTEDERLSLSGMSDQDAAAYQAALPAGKRQVLDALAARVDALQAKTLTTLERYGLMDRASLDAWRSTYQHYVPLHRDEAHPDSVSHPIGQGYSTKGDASRRRTGSNQKVTNILGHIVMQREAALTRGEKAVVGKKLYLLAAQNPDPNLWSVDKPPKIKRIDPRTGTVVSVVDPMFKNLPNVVMVRIAGKDAAITFNERNPQAVRLAEAFKNLDVGDVGMLLGWAAKGTRWFASINTQYNPIFGLINFARDLQAGLLNLATTPLAGKQGKIAADAIPAMRAIYRDVRGKGATDAPGAKLDFIDKLLAPLAPADSTWINLWAQMQEDGGTTGYRDLFADAADRANALQKELESLDRNQASKAAHAVVEWLSDYNETMENAIRLAAYKEALDMGMTRPRAASLAKNLTVNFNRKGRMGPQLGAAYAFFNASLQGTARLAETLAGPTGRKIMLGGVMVGVVNTLLGMAVMGGGDDDEWSKIPDFIKERSIIIPVGRQDYVTLPMPLGFHVLPNIGRVAVEMMLGNQEKSAGRQIGGLLATLIDAFNPMGSSQDLAQLVAPTVIDPVVALMQNKDWTGKPIYRPDWNQLDPTPGPQRAKDSASTPARVLSQFLNFATGGTEYRPGAISWTPDQIDYVIGQLTGGLGRELLKVNQTITAPFTGDELPAYKIPLVGRLYGNTRGPANQSERFYENVREINEVENEVKGRARAGQDFQAVLREEPLAALIGAGAGAEKQITELRKIRRDVVRQAQPGYQAQVQQINEQIGGVMAALNKQVRTARETAAEAR